ncbi:MAG: cell wall-binding repeat-containing protein [Peptoniphilaceae bacterium]
MIAKDNSYNRIVIQERNEHTVTFDTKGGTPVPAQTVEHGATADKPTDPQKEGYTFRNWYTDAAGSKVFDFSTPITQDTKLFAKWDKDAPPVPETYPISISGGEAQIDGITVKEAAAGETIDLKALPPEGKVFIEWQDNISGSKLVLDKTKPETSFVMPEQAVSLTGRFEDKTEPPVPVIHTVSFHTGGGSAVAAKQVKHGDPVEKPADPTKANYRFAGWYSDAAFTTRYDFATPVTESLTLYAKWTKKTDPTPPTPPTPPTGITTERIYGDNRIDTAIALSKANFTKADTVVIARADDYPDALTASVLAKAVNGPILLSYPDRVNDKVLAEISRLGAKNLLLIGGEEAMHASTAQAYAKGRNTERIGGKNRYDTASLIADTITQRTGKKTQAMIATGENFPDALAISGPASRLGTPILLVRKNGVPEETKAALTRNGITQTIVIGGEEAIPAAVAKALPGATQRLGGKNRYDTAAVIAKHFHKTAQTAYLATGEDFPDALTAGLIAGKANAPLLLTNKSILRAETVNYLKEAKVEKVIVVGGPEAITEKVVKEIK